MKKFFTSPAIILNFVLIISVAILGVISISGVFFAQSKLAAFVTQTDHLKTDAELNEQNIATGEKLKTVLASNAANIQRVEQVVADTKSYQYQDQIVRDINKYADTAGITILGFNFVQSGVTTKGAASTTPKTLTAIITTNNPINYTDFLHFLRLVEANLTKMQVTQIDLQANTDKAGLIDSQTITLQVYVK